VPMRAHARCRKLSLLQSQIGLPLIAANSEHVLAEHRELALHLSHVFTNRHYLGQMTSEEALFLGFQCLDEVYNNDIFLSLNPGAVQGAREDLPSAIGPN
jgi:hypothetical protein